MSQVSSRAQEILDAIERDALDRRAAMAAGIDGTLAGADLLHSMHRPAPPPPREMRAPRPVSLAAIPLPEAPPAPAPMATPEPATVVGGADSTLSIADAERLLALVDHVVQQTERAQERLAALDSAVTSLSGRLGNVAVPQAPVVVPAPLAIPPQVELVDPLEPPASLEQEPVLATVPRPATAPVANTDGARLVAIEMAVAGFTRSEVRDRLTREYGLADPLEILDDVFGAGSDGDSRMPWGAV